MLTARLSRWALVVVLACLTSQAAVAADPPSVVFVAQPVRTAVGEATLLVPKPVQLVGNALRDRARQIFEAIRSSAPKRYQDIELVVPDGFDLSRRLDLRCKDRDPAVCELALSEVSLSLMLIGVERVTLEPAGTVGGSDTLAAGAFLPVLPFWAALPPVRVDVGLVRVGSSYVSPQLFNEMVKGRKSALLQAARQTMRSGPATARIAVAKAASKLGVADVRSLLPLLNHPSPAVRLTGLDVLSDEKNPAFLDRCEKLVDDDPEPDVKIAAAKILVAGGRARFKSYLLLRDLRLPDENRVIDALGKLLETGDRRIATALLPLLAHASAQVRQRAAEGLVRLRAHDTIVGAISRSDLDPGLRDTLAKALVNEASGGKRDAGLKALMDSEQEESRVFAFAAVAKHRLSGHDKAVLAAIESGSPEIAKAGARAAEALRLEAAIVPLAVRASARVETAEVASEAVEQILVSLGLNRIETFAGHSQTPVRAAALRALGRLGPAAGKRGREILMARLKDPDASLQKAAVGALARTPDRAVVEKLVPLAASTDPEIRAVVIKAAAQIKHPRAAELAKKGLSDGSDEVKLAAVSAVRELKVREAVSDLWMRLKYGKLEVRRAVLRTLVALSTPEERKPRLEKLAELLYDPDPEIRSMAIDAVRGFRDLLVYANLGAVVGSAKETDLRIKALEALGETKDPRAVEHIISGGLLAEERKVQLAALDSLQAINSLKAEKALQEFISMQQDDELRSRATEVLDGLSEP